MKFNGLWLIFFAKQIDWVYSNLFLEQRNLEAGCRTRMPQHQPETEKILVEQRVFMQLLVDIFSVDVKTEEEKYP